METLEEMARKIARLANECCFRSDGYEEEIYELALKCLGEAFNYGTDYGSGQEGPK